MVVSYFHYRRLNTYLSSVYKMGTEDWGLQCWDCADGDTNTVWFHGIVCIGFMLFMMVCLQQLKKVTVVVGWIYVVTLKKFLVVIKVQAAEIIIWATTCRTFILKQYMIQFQASNSCKKNIAFCFHQMGAYKIGKSRTEFEETVKRYDHLHIFNKGKQTTEFVRSVHTF